MILSKLNYRPTNPFNSFEIIQAFRIDLGKGEETVSNIFDGTLILDAWRARKKPTKPFIILNTSLIIQELPKENIFISTANK